jgi:hypothetical protein
MLVGGDDFHEGVGVVGLLSLLSLLSKTQKQLVYQGIRLNAQGCHLRFGP